MILYQKKNLAAVLVLALAGIVVLVGCGSSEPTSAPATVAIVTQTPAPAPTSAPATMPAGSATAAPTTATSGTTETVTLVVVPEKSEARYRVREQLAGVSLPSDAVGKTNAITGQIVGKTDGSIVSADSKFVVDVRTLTSDQGMRDNFIQGTPLQSRQYPNVTFVPTAAPGLPLVAPDSGSASFQLAGDLTIKDVTKPVTWNASCQAQSDKSAATCSAKTTFTFEDFQLEQPRVGRVLSIEDSITLEVDLFLQRVNP